MKVKDMIQHAWNAFVTKPTDSMDFGASSWSPHFKTVQSYNASGFATSIYNRIAIDVSMGKFNHVKVNPDNDDVTVIHSGLNYCLNTEANIDQSGIQFIHDLVYSMFDEGVIAVVPVETTVSPTKSDGYDIKTLRVGKVTQWFPEYVTVRLYNERTGQNEDITLAKKMVAIIENPLYAVMNAENSTLKRLMNKIIQLDEQDAANSPNRLNLVIHIPYGIKTNIQKDLVQERIKNLEMQLSNSKHGIAYIDGTEKITQLNRAIDNQLPENIQRLTEQFYNQLGLTKTIFDGTASEEELRIYYSRTIDPIMEHIIAEFRRKFLTKTARTQGHDIQYYRDMFKFVTVEMLTAFGDAFRRNSIVSSNEVRKIIKMRPSSDPRADELFNPNIADKNQNIAPSPEQAGSLTPPDDKSSE